VIRYKDGVPQDGLHPRIDEALAKAEHLFAAFGLDVIVTATSNGVHRTGSLHYSVPCKAVDLRTKHMARESDKVALKVALTAALGPDFDVLYEDPGGSNQHIHCELDPEG